MGKYIRKPKLTPEVSVLEMSNSSLGVRTRSKTLHKPNSFNPDPPLGDQQFRLNHQHFQLIQRAIRESTPCDLIRDVDNISTPDSSTRNPSLTAQNQRSRSSILTNIPSTREMDELFAHFEQQQQRFFMDKYNFDIINDTPLPGRYEWVEVNL